MESKIKKRALAYGIAAVLCVLVLGAVSYNVGYFPQTRNLTPNSVTASGMFATFSSYDELKSFLMTSANTWTPFQFYGPQDVRQLSPSVTAFNAKAGAESFTFDHSSTNVQVAGIDESDFVKTDGEYIYLLSGNNLLPGNSVTILKAYPPENTEIVSRISFGELYPVGIFINGDRLVVLGSKYTVPTTRSYYGYYDVNIKTFIHVYDIQDREHPVLLHELMLSGSYFNSRMMEDYVYFVVSQPAYIIYDTVVLPKIYSDDWAIKEIVPTEIHYTNHSDEYQQFTTFVAMNIKNMTEAPTYLTIMLGSTSNMYVSLSNLYVTFPQNDKTTIYRVHITNSTITPEAHGEVPGQILNQFSMDEHGNDFRIATQTWNNSSPSSNVFILDMNLTIVGQLQDIEVGETMDSARFIENRCYLSTSVVRRDPFFVIDTENVTAPHILGYLKIPGFTRYLHPYDSNHVIGVGRDGSNRVRVSLFNVSDVSAPKNISEYSFEADWSDTPVLDEHKAFLFDYSKELLAFPVSLNYYGYNSSSIQPLMVFNITLEGGLVLKGSIIQQGTQTNGWDYSHYVQRSLYIKNVLYTISQAEVQLNSLDDLTFLKEIEIG
jgi:inhibitor of cysteine peptidase